MGFLSGAVDTVKDTVGDLSDGLGLSTKKAVLCVLNPNLKNQFQQVTILKDTQGKETGKEYAISNLAQNANELQKGLMQEAKQSLAKKIGSAISLKGGSEYEGKSAKEVKEEMKGNKYFLPFEVQYNPNSIRLETVAGRQEYKQNTQNGLKYADEIRAMEKTDTNTYMSFQLIFDDTSIRDAFMLETGSVISNSAKEIVKDFVNDKKSHSVREQVDMLIAALAKAPTRQMIFFWSNMCFRGELTRANARFTMFNTAGNPIRAVVDLTLEQNASLTVYNYDEEYWKKTFDKVFEEKGSVGGAKKFAQNVMKSNNFLSF